MGKLKASCLLLGISLAVRASAADTQRILKGIEDRYNRISTLQVNFEQVLTVRGAKRAPLKGVLYLHKPGRMRWEYASGKLFISDGEFVYDYDPEENRVRKTKLKDSGDLRGPLAFLLGRLHFEDDFREFQSEPRGGDTLITAIPKSDNMPYKDVSFLAAPDFTIKQLWIKGQDGSVNELMFDNEKRNPPVPDKMFHFAPPPGVELVDETKGK